MALSRDEVYERVKVALVDKLGTDESAISEEASLCAPLPTIARLGGSAVPG